MSLLTDWEPRLQALGMAIPDVSLAPSLPKETFVSSSIAMAPSITFTGVVVLADLPLAFLGGLVPFPHPFLNHRIPPWWSSHEDVGMSSVNKGTWKFMWFNTLVGFIAKSCHHQDSQECKNDEGPHGWSLLVPLSVSLFLFLCIYWSQLKTGGEL